MVFVALTDCYVLAPFRSAVLASRFADAFLPEREPSFDPNDPSEVLGVSRDLSLDELITGLSLDQNAEYRFYWRSNRLTEPQHAILAFNSDGSLVLGLSINLPEALSETELGTAIGTWIERLRDYIRSCKTPYGASPLPLRATWGVELPPPLLADFERM